MKNKKLVKPVNNIHNSKLVTAYFSSENNCNCW